MFTAPLQNLRIVYTTHLSVPVDPRYLVQLLWNRNSLRLSDVRVISTTAGQVKTFLLDRWSNKKQKHCPARTCVMPVERAMWSAGGIMMISAEHMGFDGAPSHEMFPLIDKDGRVDIRRTTSDEYFVRGSIRQLKTAGMSAAE